MRIVTLYSGSKGNSTYIEAGDAAILIDAGKSAKKLCSALSSIGVCIDDINAIFITHEHNDHVCALETLTKKHKIPIHMASGCAAKFSSERFELLRENIVCHPPLFEVEINGTLISSFATPHDSNMSVGYRIEFCEDGKRHAIGLATDIGYVTKDICQGLCGCEAVVLESNHDIDMLKDGPYPYDLKKRILSKRGHLSNKDSALLCSGLAKRGTHSFILAHLSEENNTPGIALDEFLSTVADSTVSVAVADPEEPTEMITQK
jgi:phosphoribosyl 1,2-cyclic phosphodiesterase